MEPILARALSVEERVLGPQDTAIAETLIHLAQLYREEYSVSGDERKNQEAVPLYQRAIAIQEKNEVSPQRLVAMLEDYASLLQELGAVDEAAAAQSRATAIRKRLAVESKSP
jgi:hypothetical protein